MPARVRTIVYERRHDPAGWRAYVPGVDGCVASGRTLSEARRRIDPALRQTFTAAERRALVEDIRLPASARASIEQAARAREAAVVARDRAVRATEEAARVLTLRLALSRRDTAALLGVSHQRVQQMLSG